MRKRLADLAFARGGLVALVVVAVYIALAPSYIVDGDNAEFSTLAATGGAAHPPGYPLYVMYLRLTSWIPGGSAAHTAAIATAVLGGASVVVLHAACRAWGARPAAASIAVALFAGGPVVIRLHTSAEVFAMNDLIAASLLWLSAAAGPLRGANRAIVLALVAGLGLSNQHICVLLAPLGMLGVVRGIREAREPAPVVIGLSVLALGVGLLPYLYLFVAPASPMAWGHVDTFDDLIAHFTRRDYAGIGGFATLPGELHPGANLIALLHTLGRAFLFVPAIGALCAIGVRIARPGDGEPRWGWTMLAASVVLAGPVLVTRFNILPAGIGLYVVQRFHLFAIVLLVVPVAAGIDLVIAEVAARTRRTGRRGFGELLAIAVFGAAAGTSLPSLLATHSPAVEKGAVNLLTSLPENAVLISISDDLHSATHYAQEVLGVRRDVVDISFGLVSLPWYDARLAARGVAIDQNAPGEGTPSVKVARQVLATGRPLFVELPLGNILRGFRTYPHGMVMRVLPEGVAPPGLDELVALNKRLYAAFDLAYPRPDRDAEYAAQMHVRYAVTWDILARALKESGRIEEARAARAVAEDLVPGR